MLYPWKQSILIDSFHSFSTLPSNLDVELPTRNCVVKWLLFSCYFWKNLVGSDTVVNCSSCPLNVHIGMGRIRVSTTVVTEYFAETISDVLVTCLSACMWLQHAYQWHYAMRERLLLHMLVTWSHTSSNVPTNGELLHQSAPGGAVDHLYLIIQTIWCVDRHN